MHRVVVIVEEGFEYPRGGRVSVSPSVANSTITPLLINSHIFDTFQTQFNMQHLLKTPPTLPNRNYQHFYKIAYFQLIFIQPPDF